MLARLLGAFAACHAVLVGAGPSPKRNVLYIVFDDLRPDLSPYQDGREAQMPMHTPHIQRLADTGIVFDRAYVQIAVCSPSRMSFATGRRPNGTQAWNFINHFREARCTTANNMRVSAGTSMAGGFDSQPHGWGYTRTGGYAQCCTSCSVSPECKGWGYENGNCTLYSAVHTTVPCTGRGPAVESFDTCISGEQGSYPQWTPLPANFKNNNYLVLGVGKYYHAGCGSLGGAKDDVDHPAGIGHPPLADRALSWSAAGPGWNGSWSANSSIQFPDQGVYAAKWGKCPSPFGNLQYLNPDDESCRGAGGESSDYCTTPWGLDGNPVPKGGGPPAGTTPLADFITYQDAILKMRFAKQNLKTNGQPFFLVTGIKRPHLNWRSPEGYVDLYPLENVSVPKQLTLDKSIDPVAWAAFPMNAPLGPDAASPAVDWAHASGGGEHSAVEPFLDPVCGEVRQNTGGGPGGGKGEQRVAKYPDGLVVANMSECCALCKPGNTIGCTAWIYSSDAKDGNCWPMAYVRGIHPNPGNSIGGTIGGGDFSCWLRGEITVSECKENQGYDTYTLEADGTWQLHNDTNCFVGHGAVWAPTAIGANFSVGSCEDTCKANPKCRAITVDPRSQPPPPGPPNHRRSPNFMTTPYTHGTDNQLRSLRQHYYATISWADYAAGQVLAELDALSLTESTMVVLHSDHGWHLGEYAEWEKRTNWELGVRIPLIMRVPWMPSASSGKHARGLVEAVDIYQTICDIMDVPLPDHEAVPFEGTSLRPILEDPEKATVKAVALSTFPRCAHIGMPSYGNRGSPGGQDNTCLDVERASFTWMGYTMRTDRFRYTEYVVWNGTSLSPIWNQLKATELYDHDGDDGPWTDPDRYENVNLAKTAAPALVKQLSAQLHAAFGFPDR